MRLCWLLPVVLLAMGCEEEATAPTHIEGTLNLEVLDTADVRIDPGEGDAMKLTVTAPLGLGLLPDGVALEADGFVERVHETGDTLYTAKIAGPAVAGGPCGSEPVSLAFSVHRPGNNAIVVGGISAYCGADTWYGVPTRVLRLTGPLPLPTTEVSP